MSNVQPGILGPVPAAGRFLTFDLAPGASTAAVQAALDGVDLGPEHVLGWGAPLARRLGREIPGLSVFPSLDAPAGAIPSTQGALWCFLRGDDGGALVLVARALARQLGGAFVLTDDVAGFRYDTGRDLTGYEDGTENPEDRAEEVVGCPGAPFGSFVAVQRWEHDLARMEAMSPAGRDAVIGRERASNEELDEAPASAHVKRAAMEGFEPAAFMLRRSMPWGDATRQGLVFVAHASSFRPFEQVLHRMVGLDDGVVDGLFQMSRPVSGGYYWCPPPR